MVASYKWETPLSSIPKEFSYLDGFVSVSISQKRNEKQCFKISLWKEDEGMPDKSFDLDMNEREKLELYLIGNPEIEYVQHFQESLIVDLFNGYEREQDKEKIN